VRDPSFLSMDAAEMGRDRVQWQSVGRSEALRACLTRRVVVVHRSASGDVATLFESRNRFFRSDGPFRYDNLRYFVFTGVSSPKLKAVKIDRPSETEALEPMEAETGEPISLGSPTARIPPKPKPFKIPELPTLPTLDIPTIPDLPTLPGIPKVPGFPEIPQIPGFPEIPTLPVVPELDLELAEDKAFIPIEYRLLDGKGNPMPPTPFKITLPDGTVESGKSDADGFIRVPDNTQQGQAKLEILDPNDTDPAKLAAFAPPKPPGKHPIELALVNAQGEPLANAEWKLKLPDGSTRQGKTDATGRVSAPDNETEGDAELTLTAFAASGA
jgi:hypothetical protein